MKKERRTVVKGVRMTDRIFECLLEEAKEEGKTISKMIQSILQDRYAKKLSPLTPLNNSEPIKMKRVPKITLKDMQEFEKMCPPEEDRICYPLDNIKGKPLKASNRIWLKGETITYGELIQSRYKQYKTRIIKADLKGIPLDDIIKGIEKENT